MIEKFTQEVMICSSLMDGMEKSKVSIFKYIKCKDIDQIAIEVNNRTRLVKIIEVFLIKIEKISHIIYQKKSTQFTNELIISWNRDVQKWIERTNKNDQAISNSLEELRLHAMNEIAEVHLKNRQFKGYNLNDLKP